MLPPTDNKDVNPFALLLAIVLAGVAVACQWPIEKQSSTIHLRARPWPAADRLFRQDPWWLGADDAH
ncbi:MAG: hypothetical protein KFF68_02845, partial [Desulfosarcina sp.]|nr:hypothetical protein [Desulfosarcina sp.]